MNKELIKRMLINPSIQMDDLTTFIVEYVEFKKKKVVSQQELQIIIQLIQIREFDLRYALIQAAISLNLNVLSTFDKHDNLLRTDVYE